MPEAPMLLMEDVSKIYGDGPAAVRALEGVSLHVEKGEFAAIVGASGSGKSTLLQLAGALDVPTHGEIRVEGRSLADCGDRELTFYRRRRVGFVFQGFNLLPRLSAEQNVALPLLLDGARSAKALARAREALAAVGLEHRVRHVPSEMSGGEQQRVAIARALVGEPAVLLADEPTGNLDSKTGSEVLDLLIGVQSTRALTVVMVTHDEGVARMADRTIRIRDGRLVPGAAS